MQPVFLLGLWLHLLLSWADEGVVRPAPGFQTLPLTFAGRVVDNEGQPLSGATVLVKGTATAVSTNADGAFLITMPGGPHTLLVDCYGYRALQYPILRPDSALVLTLFSTRTLPKRKKS